jgi:hypothetical protein
MLILFSVFQKLNLVIFHNSVIKTGFELFLTCFLIGQKLIYENILMYWTGSYQNVYEKKRISNWNYSKKNNLYGKVEYKQCNCNDKVFSTNLYSEYES